MIVVGLTGSIGMGKSTTADFFEEGGIPVWDADAAVHRLYAPGGAAVVPVLAEFPGAAADDGGIDRAKLSELTLGQPEALKTLEEIVHPLVREDQASFLAQAREKGAEMVLLDIPLLVEGGMAGLFAEIVVVTADEDVCRQRVLARPGMTAAKLDAILARQASEAERLKHATHIIRTDQGLPAARARTKEVIKAIREKQGLSPNAE